jgi:hypothetical protein
VASLLRRLCSRPSRLTCSSTFPRLLLLAPEIRRIERTCWPLVRGASQLRPPSRSGSSSGCLRPSRFHSSEMARKVARMNEQHGKSEGGRAYLVEVAKVLRQSGDKKQGESVSTNEHLWKRRRSQHRKPCDQSPARNQKQDE